jgi:23S rRNA (guanosine2251-2'-O)-methyltransferase
VRDRAPPRDSATGGETRTRAPRGEFTPDRAPPGDFAPSGDRPPRGDFAARERPARPSRAGAPERSERPAPATRMTRMDRMEGAERPTRGARPAGSEFPARRGNAPGAPPSRGGRGRAAPPPEREERARPAPKPRFMPDGGGRHSPAPRAEPAASPREPAPEAMREKPAGPGTLWIYGQHAVAAALANPARRNRRLLLTADAEEAMEQVLPKPWGSLTAERVEKARFHTFLPEDSLHQGAALLTEPLNPPPLERLIVMSQGPVLLLDQVTDPRNVGAILRSAAAFGAAAVVVQDRNAPPETGALARAASGALEKVPMLREVNLSRVIMALQKAGFWVIGMDAGAESTLAEVRKTIGERRVALVMGAEESGLRRLQRESCDELARLPMDARMESLNVSNAAAIALYEFAREG